MQWLNKIRATLIRDIAIETERRMTVDGWGKFLPPVVLHDCIYLVREDGAIYRLHQDSIQGMELITKIRSHI